MELLLELGWEFIKYPLELRHFQTILCRTIAVIAPIWHYGPISVSSHSCVLTFFPSNQVRKYNVGTLDKGDASCLLSDFCIEVNPRNILLQCTFLVKKSCDVWTQTTCSLLLRSSVTNFYTSPQKPYPWLFNLPCRCFWSQHFKDSMLQLSSHNLLVQF